MHTCKHGRVNPHGVEDQFTFKILWCPGSKQDPDKGNWLDSEYTPSLTKGEPHDRKLNICNCDLYCRYPHSSPAN